GRLHEPAEPKLAPEVAGRRDDGRDDPRELSVARREVGQALPPTHDVAPVAHHRLEALAKAAKLVRLAAVERHAFRVLAEADEAKAEARFVPRALEVESDEGTADPVRQPRPGDRIQHGDPHHVARE